MYFIERLEKLKQNLKDDYFWAICNEWEVPISLPEDLDQAISAIDKLIMLYEKGVGENENLH